MILFENLSKNWDLFQNAIFLNRESISLLLLKIYFMNSKIKKLNIYVQKQKKNIVTSVMLIILLDYLRVTTTSSAYLIYWYNVQFLIYKQKTCSFLQSTVKIQNWKVTENYYVKVIIINKIISNAVKMCTILNTILYAIRFCS